MKFSGTWYISKMEMWEEDYFNMEGQAFIEIAPNGSGHFQFGLVSGYIDGKLINHGQTEILDFTWEGNDENDDALGSGWIKLKEKDIIEGRIKFHMGEASGFSARLKH